MSPDVLVSSMDEEEIDELHARIDALRMVLAIVMKSVLDPADMDAKLLQAEEHSRRQNLPSGTIEELAVLRKILSGD